MTIKSKRKSKNESRSLNLLSNKNTFTSSLFSEFFTSPETDQFNNNQKSLTLPFNKPLPNTNLDTSLELYSSSNNSRSSSTSSTSSDNCTIKNIIMTTASTTLPNSSSVLLSPAASLSENRSFFKSSPVLQQPQAVMSNLSISTPSSNTLTKSSNTANSNSNVIKTNTISYLDENNLKLAVVDYPDILKLIKLQNLIEYQEWIAFNSKSLKVFYYLIFSEL